jgi:hypothetical protein
VIFTGRQIQDHILNLPAPKPRTLDERRYVDRLKEKKGKKERKRDEKRKRKKMAQGEG